jgi:hypothetical protein
VAWTLTDLADLDRPGDAELAEAIALNHNLTREETRHE